MLGLQAESGWRKHGLAGGSGIMEVLNKMISQIEPY
jgi:hypothetical protein